MRRGVVIHCTLQHALKTRTQCAYGTEARRARNTAKGVGSAQKLEINLDTVSHALILRLKHACIVARLGQHNLVERAADTDVTHLHGVADYWLRCGGLRDGFCGYRDDRVRSGQRCTCA